VTTEIFWTTTIDSIQMMHDGECDMLKYICPEVEMSTWGQMSHH